MPKKRQSTSFGRVVRPHKKLKSRSVPLSGAPTVLFLFLLLLSLQGSQQYRAGYGPQQGKPVEIPVQYEGHNGQTPHQWPAQPAHHQAQPAPVPKKCGDVWEIPIQHLGPNSVPAHSSAQINNNFPGSNQQPNSQQFPPPASVNYASHPSQGGSTLGRQAAAETQKSSVNIPIVHQGGGLASPHPQGPAAGAGTDSPKPDFSKAVPPTSYGAPPNLREPAPDYSQQPQSHGPTAPHGRQPSPQSTPAPAGPQQPKGLEEKAFDLINGVVNDVRQLDQKVNSFRGIKGSKEYRFLEEMLTRSLLKLDSVEAGSHESIRQARKQAIRLIEAALDLLELKAVARGSDTDAQSLASGSSSGDTSQYAAAAPQQPTPSNAGLTSSSSAQQVPRKDPAKVKEMTLDSEIPC